jgi:hypothetical protein
VPYAYRTQNALYFVCGSHYVEAIASAPNESLITAAEAMARRMAASDPDNAAPIQELALFPSEDLVQRSYTLQTADAFGFDQFTNVFTAEYRAGEASVMAFITCCPTSREAAKLSKAYGAFLLANGGKEAPGGSDSGRRVEIMGGMEIIFTEDRFVWGIHNASSLPLAEKVAKQLRVKLVGSKGVRTSWGAASQFHA